jgi:hypothetical protein
MISIDKLKKLVLDNTANIALILSKHISDRSLRYTKYSNGENYIIVYFEVHNSYVSTSDISIHINYNLVVSTPNRYEVSESDISKMLIRKYNLGEILSI